MGYSIWPFRHRHRKVLVVAYTLVLLSFFVYWGTNWGTSWSNDYVISSPGDLAKGSAHSVAHSAAHGVTHGVTSGSEQGPEQGSDDEFRALFGNSDDNKSLGWKVQRLAQKHNITPPVAAVSPSHTKTRLPAYFVSNFLLQKQNTLPEELQIQVAALQKKHYPQLTVTSRYLPLVEDNFDYRLTLAVHFSHVRHHLASNKQSLAQFDLPFSWYDFADLSLLNSDIKVNFFFEWLVHNRNTVPQAFKESLLKHYYGDNFGSGSMHKSFEEERKLRQLDLDDFEMFLRQFMADYNSCKVFYKSDELSVRLIDLVDHFYDYNFPHLAANKRYLQNPDLKVLLNTPLHPEAPGAASSADNAKLKQILSNKAVSNCRSIEDLPESLVVGTEQYYANLSGFQPKLRFNVLRGVNEKYHLIQRLIYAKSYLYNYNGINNADIKPLKITVLNGKGSENFYEFKTNMSYSTKSDRLLDNDGYLVNEYIEKTLIQERGMTMQQLFDNRDNIEVDLLHEFELLQQKYPAKRIDQDLEFPLASKANDKEIHKLINYAEPPSDTDLYIDSFVNIESEKFLADFEASKVKKSSSVLKYRHSIEYSNSMVEIKSVPKYFYEMRLLPEKGKKKPPNTGHYDWRFFTERQFEQQEVQQVLSHMGGTWLKLTESYKIKTWIAHGTLLGWYYSGKNLPWDLDLDVQMPIKDLNMLCLKFNTSLIMEDPHSGSGLYFLDCGSSITHRSKENGRNNIDARLVDTKTGFYIDITGVSFSGSKTPAQYSKVIEWETGAFFDAEREKQFSNKISKQPYNEGYMKSLEKKMFRNFQCNLKLQIVNCRNNHFVELSQLLPLKKVIYEGAMAYVPQNYTEILLSEYKNLRRPYYSASIYIQDLGIWINEVKLRNYLRKFYTNNYEKLGIHRDNLGSKIKKMLAKFDLIHKVGSNKNMVFSNEPWQPYAPPLTFSLEELVVFLDSDPRALNEYVLSQQLLEYHYREMSGVKQELDESLYRRPDLYFG